MAEKRFEYAVCGRENFRIRKKIFAEKKIPDTCGHDLKHVFYKVQRFVNYTNYTVGTFAPQSVPFKKQNHKD